MPTRYAYGVIPESEKLPVPKTPFDRKVRALADAAMSVCNHDCSPDFDIEYHHEVKALEVKFRKILKAGPR